MVNVIAAAKVSRTNSYRPVIDTIIKLDTIKDKKLLKGKKSAAASATKKGAPAKNDTTKNQGGLKSMVNAHAEDSTRYDDSHQILYLYGRARVTYEDFSLDAEYIRVDEKSKIIFASGMIDPITHRYIGRPISKQKKEKPVTSDSLRFNYETKKGKIYNAASEQDQNFISGGQVKILKDDEAAYRNILFSTCDLPYPDTHFGIVITRGIGEKNQIVSGPAYLEIEGVPLPLAIPFGFFPKPNTRTSGVIIPTFGEDQKLGFYLRNFGYYIALNDYIDLTSTGTFYSKGSYEVNESARYLSRYKYSGTLSLSYSSTNYGLPGDPPNRDFHIDWSHSQNPNSNPGTTFSASVNAGTAGFFQHNPASNGYSLQTLTQNSLRSSISYGRVWSGAVPLNLTVNLSHSQDLTNKTVTLELPTFNFNMSTVSPFDSKERVGEQKWYQKITLGYSLQGTNKLNDIPESQLFKSETLTKKLQNGFQHQIPIGFNQNILKYFQFSTGVNYTERWYFQTVHEHFARGSVPGRDSLVFDTVGGFKRAGEYTANASVSTKIYSTLSFKSGRLTAIRYVATPSLSLGYHPDFSDPSFGYYQTAVSSATIPYQISSRRYSIFQNAVYGGPSQGKQAGVGLSIDNNIEAKVKPKSTDTSTTDKKIKILEGFNIATFYNFAADSFKLSAITFAGHTSFFKDKINVSFSGSLDPYVTQVRDSITSANVFKYKVPVNRYTFQDGKFPTLTSFNVSASASLNPAIFKPHDVPPAPGTSIQNMNPDQASKLALLNSDPSAYVDFNVPWNISLNYSFNYTNSYTSTFVTNTVMISGDVNVTPKWKVQYTTNYDLRANKLSSATSFGIYRDLHCWDLSFQWLPFGYYKSYNVTLRVKAAILQDLKLTKRSDYTNNQYYNPNQ